ncbi:MAG TPA: hypothetical protein PLW75_10040 [Hyphomicrobium sp.]|nr:hypothetical protein [Hyphomicrobium sp.]
MNIEHVRSFVLSLFHVFLMRGFLSTNADSAANPKRLAALRGYDIRKKINAFRLKVIVSRNLGA